VTETDAIKRILAQMKGRPGALEVLQGIQEALGYVPASAIPAVAEGLNLSRAEVHGVVTFHDDFRRTPPGKHTVSICQAESCQALGGEALAARARATLGVDFHQTTPDGCVTLELVYCLGLCSSSPTLMLDGEVHGRVTPEKLDELLAAVGKPCRRTAAE
jgi:formate dehydrogenase subunit gamma